MNVLCIFNWLPVPGGGDPKEGLFPTILRNHARAGFNPSVIVIKGRRGDGATLDNCDLIESCKQLGGEYVVARSRRSVRSFLSISVTIAWQLLRERQLNAIRRWLRHAWVLSGWVAAFDTHAKQNGYPDLISAVHGCEFSGILAYMIKRKHRIPYVLWERRSSYERGKIRGVRASVARTVIQDARLVLTVSPQLRTSMEKAIGISIPHLTVLPDTVPEEAFLKPKHGNGVEKFAKGRYIFASWAIWRKGKRLDLLMDAFQKFYGSNEKCCLIVAGPGSDPAKEEIARKGLEGAVSFVGPLDREGIYCLAHGCDCCVVPSDYETFGLPAVEAMAAGKPVIATRCGGPESIVSDSSLGILTEPGQVDEIVHAMSEVMSRKSETSDKHIVSECRRRFSEESVSRQLRLIYSQLDESSP